MVYEMSHEYLYAWQSNEIKVVLGGYFSSSPSSSSYSPSSSSSPSSSNSSSSISSSSSPISSLSSSFFFWLLFGFCLLGTSLGFFSCSFFTGHFIGYLMELCENR